MDFSVTMASAYRSSGFAIAIMTVETTVMKQIVVSYKEEAKLLNMLINTVNHTIVVLSSVQLMS